MSVVALEAACLIVLAFGASAAMGQARPAELPASWAKRWASPPAGDRPLQIIHGIDPAGKAPAGMGQIVADASIGEATHASMSYYKDRGLGGVVCNVTFENYLESEPSWNALVAAVDACKKLGLTAWIYDEAGYPSGAAGGLVLRDHPEYEAMELAYDASKADPFVVRPAYEFTHASNNYYAARRYINLIDDRAVRCFIEKTHEAYKARLGSHIGATVPAFFTDEPSLITVNLGQIPEEARRNVPVVDAVDPTVKALPAVPWVYDIVDRYKERFGEDLMASRKSLFTGDTDADRKVRTQYWSLVADLISDRFFGALERWCAANGVASSGHTLWEEALLHHPTLEGNGLKALSHMHIPGLDMLSSNPETFMNGSWMTVALPASAAVLRGGRRVFTEISDFSEKMSHAGPASVGSMQAAAAWQAAWGVTEFTLYYGIADRSADDYRAYCEYVGRLNAILKPARLDPDVLLYYPVRDLWAEYRPTAAPISGASQSARAQTLYNSFERLGQTLARNQVHFCLIDHEFLAKAQVRGDGRLVVKGHAFRAIVLPEGVELPAAAAKVVARFQAKGGKVLRDAAGQQLTGASMAAAIQPEYRLDTADEHVMLGRYTRDGRPIVVVLNAGGGAYKGNLATPWTRGWLQLDPATGATGPAASGAAGSVALELAPRHAVILVGRK